SELSRPLGSRCDRRWSVAAAVLLGVVALLNGVQMPTSAEFAVIVYQAIATPVAFVAKRWLDLGSNTKSYMLASISTGGLARASMSTTTTTQPTRSAAVA